MAKKKRKNKKNTENLIEKMLNSRSIRIPIVTKSHFWFFNFYFSKYVTYEPAPFHRQMFGLTEDEKKKMVVVVSFRGSAKTTLFCTSFPLWAILGKLKKRYIFIVRQTQAGAAEHMQNLKNHLEHNELLRKDLGPFKEGQGPWSSESIFIPRFNAKIRVASAEQQGVRSAIHGNVRPDLIILDDVDDLSSVKTRESRDKTWNWFAGDIIGLGDMNTKYVVTGNLLHEDSLIKRLEKEIKSGKLEGEYRQWAIVDENGKPAWPGKFPTIQDVKAFKRTIPSEAAWQREYMLTILPDEYQVIRNEWIKHYELLPPQSEYYAYTAIGVDPAISEKSTADYTAMVAARVYGKSREELMIYILPTIINERLTMFKTIGKAQALSSGLGLNSEAELYVEDVGYQHALIEHLRNDGYPVTPVKVYGQNKRERLTAVSHLVESGKVWFPQEGAEELIGQLVNFGAEKHDDLADAFSLLILEIVKQSNWGRVGQGLAEGPIEWNLLNSREIKVLEEQGYHRPVPERQLKPEYMRPVRHGQRSNRLYEEDDFF